MRSFPSSASLLRPALFAGLVFACAIGLVALNDQRRLDYDRTAAVDLLDVLANQLASGAGQAMLTGDRLSLQALVTELAAHPQIQSAAIFDAADKPLVVSGVAGQGNYSLDALIRVDNSLAGYARVSLAAAPVSNGLTDPMVLMVAAAAALLAFLGSFHAAGQRHRPGIARDNSADVIPPNHEASPVDDGATLARGDSNAAAAAQAAPVGAQVVLAFSAPLARFPALQRHLVDASEQIGEWYGGKIRRNDAGIVGSFNRGEDFNFRAFCASRLWQQLLQAVNQQQTVLDTTITVRQLSETDDQHPDQVPGNIYITRLVLAEGDLSRHLRLVEEDDDWYQVTAVGDEIDQLLQKQLDYLLQALDDSEISATA